MRRIHLILSSAIVGAMLSSVELMAQEAKPSGDAGTKAGSAAQADSNNGHAYSGMYTFLKEGEFVQISVQDAGHVSGFVSRFGDGESDKGAFLDQFFKNGKLEGNKLSFTTEVVHGNLRAVIAVFALDRVRTRFGQQHADLYRPRRLGADRRASQHAENHDNSDLHYLVATTNTLPD